MRGFFDFQPFYDTEHRRIRTRYPQHCVCMSKKFNRSHNAEYRCYVTYSSFSVNGNPSTPVACNHVGSSRGLFYIGNRYWIYFLYYARNRYRTTESRGFRRPAWEETVMIKTAAFPFPFYFERQSPHALPAASVIFVRSVKIGNEIGVEPGKRWSIINRLTCKDREKKFFFLKWKH